MPIKYLISLCFLIYENQSVKKPHASLRKKGFCAVFTENTVITVHLENNIYEIIVSSWKVRLVWCIIMFYVSNNTKSAGSYGAGWDENVSSFFI